MKRRSPARSMLAVYAVGVLALGLYSGVAASSFGGSAGRAAARGSVSALFAGSLVDYMEGDFGPSFEQATGRRA